MDTIQQLRRKIDNIDAEILALIAQRAEICKSIGSTKKANGLPVRDAAREAEIYERIREQAAKFGLNPVQVESVYREIVNMCSSVQE